MTNKSPNTVTLEKIEAILFQKNEFLENQLWLAGLHLVLFEFLRDMVRNRLETFFGQEFDLDDQEELRATKFDPEHEHLFRGNGRKLFALQLEQLQEMGAINVDDIALIQFFREQRNEVAHRLINILTKDDVPPIDPLHIRALLGLVYKIDNWWFREVEVGIQPELADQFQQEDLEKGHSIATQLLIHFVNNIIEKIEPNSAAIGENNEDKINPAS